MRTNLHDTLMLRRFYIAGLAATLLLVSGCAGLDTRLPEIATKQLQQEKITQEKLALTEWDSMAERLLRVGRPILLANEGLCPKIHPDIGALTHNQKSYDKRLREGSQRELGVGEDTEIFHIAINGPAHEAGLRRGDIIRDEKGRALRSAAISKALKAGETLQLDRDGALSTLSLKGDMACAYNLRLSQSAAINAYADGRNITVTTGMMNFIESDEELALIVGHELAHNTMGHIRKIIGNYILSGLATRYTRPFESEADYVGLYYAKRAGYDIDGVEGFWRRLAKVSPKNIGRAKTHPNFPDRYLRLAATRKEIEEKIAKGEPLLPNFIGKKPSRS